MSLEANLYNALNSLVGGRVYPDDTKGAALPLVYPLIVYQTVGGQAYDYANQSMPDHDHARAQVVVWAETRLEASTLARQARAALLAAITPCETYGAAVSLRNEELNLYGARQDFGIWYLP
jgi:hypothetical protein